MLKANSKLRPQFVPLSFFPSQTGIDVNSRFGERGPLPGVESKTPRLTARSAAQTGSADVAPAVVPKTIGQPTVGTQLANVSYYVLPSQQITGDYEQPPDEFPTGPQAVTSAPPNQSDLSIGYKGTDKLESGVEGIPINNPVGQEAPLQPQLWSGLVRPRSARYHPRYRTQMSGESRRGKKTFRHDPTWQSNSSAALLNTSVHNYLWQQKRTNSMKST